MDQRKKEKALRNIPTVLVIFGATGDLTAKKVAPALYGLFQQGDLPSMFHLVGFSRRMLDDRAFQKYIFEILAKQNNGGADSRGKFCGMLSYQRGVFERASDYRKLRAALKRIDARWGVCSNKLFYLAVPPEYYETIFKQLKTSGLTEPCSPEEGWTPLEVSRPEAAAAAPKEGGPLTGFMAGRVAIGNPFFFRRYGRNPDPLGASGFSGRNDVTLAEKMEAMCEHARLCEELMPWKPFVHVRKHLSKYASGERDIKSLRTDLMKANNAEDMRQAAERFLANAKRGIESVVHA